MNNIKIKVVVGAHNLSLPSARRDVFVNPSLFIIHEEFNYDQELNDIALIRLNLRIHFRNKIGNRVQKISLPEQDEELEQATSLTLSGWGMINYSLRYDSTNDKCVTESGESTKVLKTGNYKIIEDGACEIYDTTPRSKICVDEKPEKSSLEGDSGSLYIVQDWQRGPMQVAIVSYKFSHYESQPFCHVGFTRVVATKVSYYRNWINKNIYL